MIDPSHPHSGSATDRIAPTAAGESNVPEVRIEIQELAGGDLHLSRQITIHVVDNSTAMIVDQTLGLGAQAVGAVMAVALGTSAFKWPLYFVELSIIIGLSFTYAAIPLRRRRSEVSAVVARIGAIATAVAIIVSVSSHLPLPLAFAVAPFAVLVVSALSCMREIYRAPIDAQGFVIFSFSFFLCAWFCCEEACLVSKE